MNVLVFDVETSRHCGNLPWQPSAYIVSLCLKLNDEIRTFIFNHKDVPFKPIDLPEIQSYFDRADVIIAHNLKFDLHWIHHIGVDTSNNRYFDTLVAEYLIRGQRAGTKLSLKDLSTKYGIPEKIDAVAEWWDSGYETDEIPLDTLIPYGEQDVLNCEAIFKAQIPIIKAQNQSKIVKLRSESLRVTQQIEYNGMMIDKDFCSEMSSDYDRQITEMYDLLNQIVTDVLPELIDVPFKLSSNEHLSAILFGGELKYEGYVDGKREGTLKKGKVSVMTKGFGFTPREGTEAAKQGYYSVDKAQLDGLKCKPKTPQYVFINSMADLSKMEKMKSTYCDSLLEKEVNSIVHPSINETTTRTGRYSASNPNTQNMPREGTSPIKGMFITRYKD